jgi:hypothetical protein
MVAFIRLVLNRAPWAASCPMMKRPETTSAITISRPATAKMLDTKTRATNRPT